MALYETPEQRRAKRPATGSFAAQAGPSLAQQQATARSMLGDLNDVIGQDRYADPAKLAARPPVTAGLSDLGDIPKLAAGAVGRVAGPVVDLGRQAVAGLRGEELVNPNAVSDFYGNQASEATSRLKQGAARVASSIPVGETRPAQPAPIIPAVGVIPPGGTISVPEGTKQAAIKFGADRKAPVGRTDNIDYLPDTFFTTMPGDSSRSLSAQQPNNNIIGLDGVERDGGPREDTRGQPVVSVGTDMNDRDAAAAELAQKRAGSIFAKTRAQGRAAIPATAATAQASAAARATRQATAQNFNGPDAILDRLSKATQTANLGLAGQKAQQEIESQRRIGELQGIAADLNADPAARAQAIEGINVLTGRDAEEFKGLALKEYNEMGQVIGEKPYVFGNRTGRPVVDGQVPTPNQAKIQDITAQFKSGNMKEAEYRKQLKALGVPG